ncbi:hypothetical protein [Chitinophaga defluvii]|uniref:Uncharacterized protein n=1 Tax=Chitinophaga defluvii TaxID=3163343 RepID=A0ABV2TBC6_9BACT
MGQRANYIIKDGDNIKIYYHHWRANTIPSDLYLGEKAFLQYVQACTLADDLMDPVWMEGFVIMDIEKKQVGFWAWEFENETSIVRYLLLALHEKWPGWEILHLANRMYQAEKVFGIDYISKQTPNTFTAPIEVDIPTIGLEMPEDEVRKTFKCLTKFQETYDPSGIIDHLSQELNTKIEVINPYFYDNVTPTKPPIHRIVDRILYLFRKTSRD